MGGVSLLDLNLPFYIVITLLFAYLVWSKFLNKGKLTLPKNADNLLKVIGLFFIILPSLMGLSFILFLIGDISNIKLDLIKAWDISKSGVVIFILVLIYALLILLTNKKVGKKDLENTLFFVLISYLIFMSIFLGHNILIIILLFRHLLLNMIFILIPFLIAMIIGYTIISSVFGVKILNPKFKFPWIIILILFLSSFGFSLLTNPIFEYKAPIKLNYYVYDLDPRFLEVYSRIRVPIEIRTFGYLDSKITHIPISYIPYNINTEKQGGKFNLLINTSIEKELQTFITGFENIKNYNKQSTKKYSFISLDIDEISNLIRLNFDKNNIKKQKIKEIVLEGFVKENITKLDYDYYDNSETYDVCYETGCKFVFNITNNLKLPVYQEEDTIINFQNTNVYNKSRCRFVNVTSNFPLKGDRVMLDPACKGNSCELTIRDLIKGERIFEMELYLEEDIVTLAYLEMKEPIQVYAEFDLIC